MKYLITIIVGGLVFAGCVKRDEIRRLSSNDANAESVFVTQDQKGNPVVAWTERKGGELTFHFAVSPDGGRSFSDKVSVPLTKDVATHAEGMPKVAFGKDGTIIAAYEKKAPTDENKYAGAIFYVVSSDGGKSWTREKYLHSDTTAGRSRSYFDIERLPDGEIGASWLDIKLDGGTGGRSVKFARTQGQAEFGSEVLVDSSACQCCRIDVNAEPDGNITIAYRGLTMGTMGRSIRDIMIATSRNGGKDFTTPVKLSQDDWVIDACPHTGASLSSESNMMYAAWYTEGNGTGIYYSTRSHNDFSFGPRQLISNRGRRPQLSASDKGVVVVWEENAESDGKTFTSIHYQVMKGLEVKEGVLSPAEANAFLPVVTSTEDGFVVAFLMESESEVGVYCLNL
jgi:hypothetical protein